MGFTGNIVFWFSLCGVAVISTMSYMRHRNLKRLLLLLVPIFLSGVLYYQFFGQGPNITSKGSENNESSFIVILYVCMLVGMLSHYLYTLLMQSQSARQPFSMSRFFAPIFASPIVFIPLLGAFQSTDIDLANLTLPKIMVFFVAFENGFFWKEIVDNHGKGK